MYVIASVILEVFREMRANLKRFASKDPTKVGSTAKPPPEFIAKMGGRLLLIDWDNRELLATMPLHTTMGFCFMRTTEASKPGDEGMLVCSAWSPRMYQLDREGRFEREFAHRGFNNLHSVEHDVWPDRYLVSASGTDALFQIDGGGRVTWEWWACENGITMTADGTERILDRYFDHRPIEYPTLTRTAHPNSVIADGPDHVVACLFHKNMVARINRATGEVTAVLEGLDHPHDIRRHPDGYTVADSRKHAVVFMDRAFNVVQRLEAADSADAFEWIQCASPTSRETMLISDDLEIGGDHDTYTRGNRLLEVDPKTGISLRQMHVSPDWRLDQVLEIPPEIAERYRKTWQPIDATQAEWR